jgi:hypothetical protein
MAANRMLRLTFGLLALVATGCGSRRPVPYHAWVARPTPYQPVASSGNAFDGYASAALIVEAAPDAHLDRVSFFPMQRQAAENSAKDAFSLVVSSTAKSCDFIFTPHSPFQPTPYDGGWRLLGRIFAWKVADACKAGDFNGAISLAATGTKFGFDLTGGGALDASLGCTIVDDIRRAIAPYLNDMGAGQLETLGNGIQEALSRLSPLKRTLDNEHENMLQAVQALQDAFIQNQVPALVTQLGPSARDAGDYLESLQGKDAKRALYFEGFANESDDITKRLISESAMSARDRVPVEKAAVAALKAHEKERVWRRFAQHFFGSSAPLLPMEDATVARTRLLILTTGILVDRKVLNAYPSDLSKFAGPITVDPYSGRPFIYHTDSDEYDLYSVGPNLVDDGGDTDSTYTRPDLKLEIPE